jgi:hypothetical protein
VTRDQAMSEMVEGYRDGLDFSSPAPSDNRSLSYQHGFANARDDRFSDPRTCAAELRIMAEAAIAADRAA